MEYDLVSIKQQLSGMKPFKGGQEGDVYKLTDNTVVKVRKREIIPIDIGYDFKETNNLAEIQRMTLHKMFLGAAEYNKLITKGGKRIRLVNVHAAFIDGSSSVSVMDYEEGTPMRSFESSNIYNRLRPSGLALDRNDGNTVDNGTENVILEIFNMVRPEVLKFIGNVPSPLRSEPIANLARAHLLGMTMRYPSRHIEQVEREEFWGSLSWRDMQKVCPLLAALGDTSNEFFPSPEQLKEVQGKFPSDFLLGPGSYKYMHSARDAILDQEKWQWAMVTISDAKRHFGNQFKIRAFNWNTDSALANYGIDEQVFHEFRTQVDAQRGEIKELMKFADREAKREGKSNSVFRYHEV